MRKVYMDHMSTTPTDPRVVEEMLPFFTENFGNPSSHLHSYGLRAKKAVDESRAKVADLINAKPEEIIFTFTGSEANNLALRGLALANKSRGKHIIISEIEHFSILYTARELEKEGFKVSYLKVNKDGLVDPDDVAKSINKDTFLVSIMHANNEIGVIEPIQEIGNITKEKGIIFPKTYSPGVKTTYIKDNTQETIEKSEVKKGKIYFYNSKGELVRTGNIKGDNVLYDKGDVKREKIRGNRIYQYDKDGKLLGKIEVRPYEIKKILPDGKIEKFKIKIKR